MASTSMSSLATANNDFAFDLYKTISEEQENLFFSPFSIMSALTMALMGAKDTTADQMKDTLKVRQLEDAALRESFAELTAMLKTQEGSGYVLHVANRLFARQGYSFLEEYLSVTRKHFQAEAQTLDFAGDTEGSRQTINKWVEDQTAQKIKDLLPPGSIDGLTAMILANAIYFKGKWDEEFDVKDTMKRDFRVTATETIQVDMMNKEDTFSLGYSQELDCKSVQLPYKGKDLSMVCVIPNKPCSLPDLEKKMTRENLQPLIDCPDSMKVTVWLPKFKVEQEANLKKKLHALGMVDMFVPGQADLSGMDGTRELYVSEVVHKAYVEVSEEGTEAAAATGVQMMLMCMPMQFEANHPFLFFIKDNRSGCILFMGRVMRPSS